MTTKQSEENMEKGCDYDNNVPGDWEKIPNQWTLGNLKEVIPGLDVDERRRVNGKYWYREER